MKSADDIQISTYGKGMNLMNVAENAIVKKWGDLVFFCAWISYPVLWTAELTTAWWYY